MLIGAAAYYYPAGCWGNWIGLHSCVIESVFLAKMYSGCSRGRWSFCDSHLGNRLADAGDPTPDTDGNPYLLCSDDAVAVLADLPVSQHALHVWAVDHRL